MQPENAEGQGWAGPISAQMAPTTTGLWWLALCQNASSSGIAVSWIIRQCPPWSAGTVGLGALRWGDFAETWAHYLHIIGTLAKIADSGLVVQADRVKWDLARDVDARVSYADCAIEDSWPTGWCCQECSTG